MRKVILLILCWIISSTVFAAAKSSAASGSWSVFTNWSPASVPNSGDDVTINHAITYTGSLDGSSYNSLTIASGAKLTVSSDFVLNSGHAVIINPGGTLEVHGSVLSSGSGSISNSGTITVTNNLSIASGNTFVNLSGASMSIGGSIVSAGGGSFFNNGAVAVTGSVSLDNGNDFTNSVGASFTVLGSMLSPGYGTMNNHGSLVLGGYGELNHGSAFTNDGHASVAGGFNLYGGYTFSNVNGYIFIGGVLWTEDWKSDLMNTNGWIEVVLPISLGTGVHIIGGTLPIELSTFQAQQQQRKVVLQWETLSELSNDFFTLERSYDGVRFESIADIDGAGSSKQKHSYTYVDDVYSLRSSQLYYRLSQTDYDGANTYSQVLSVPYVPLIDEEFTVFTKGSQILLVPNKKGCITIYSEDGKMCYISEILSLDMLCINLPLPAGVYLVCLLADDGIQSKSILLR